MSTARYALFFSPLPGTQPAQIGATWLGRDVDSGRTVLRAHHPGLSLERAARIVVEPRHYGFHATLRAPFRPAEGVNRDAIADLTESLATRLAPVTVPSLVLRKIANFFALVPADPCPAIDALAAACVEATDSVRAPLDQTEMARRRAAPLSKRQKLLLARWGYPFVMEEFQFHMTVAGPIGDSEAGEVPAALENHFRPLIGQPMGVDTLSLFHQPGRGRSFQRIGIFPLDCHAPVISTSPENASKDA